jgi:hypothetical protein
MDILEDIRIIVQGRTAKIGGLTTRGIEWLLANMVVKPFSVVTIEVEYLDEIKALIKNDGLTYKEKE